MFKNSKLIIVLLTVISVCQGTVNVSAQETQYDDLSAWHALDEEIRQVMIEEISARRALDANDQNPDWLIRSVTDIQEAIILSCELSSGSCQDTIGQGEELPLPAGYTAERGLEAGETIRRFKSGIH